VSDAFPLGARLTEWVSKAAYIVTLALAYPVNFALARARRGIRFPNSVLHVSYMVHIPYYTTRVLRRHGWKADYLAVGESAVWSLCDYRKLARWRFDLALRELFLFWSVVAKYEVVHLHFMITMSVTGWELPLLKRMGRKIVVHFRGCEARNRERNMALHPEVNICQDCDYNATVCRSSTNVRRRRLAKRYGDRVLVTTPDMKDFLPEAEHFPFFAPEIDEIAPSSNGEPPHDHPFRIVHVTNHPGIEGTPAIRRAVEKLKQKGHAIEFVFLNGVPHEQVLAALRSADLAIGKMKMGYYANAQIESMAAGVPTITYVRPEFVSDELLSSGFILCELANLEATLEHYLTHPHALEAKRRIARASILRLHDNDALAQRLIGIYSELRSSGGV